MVLGDSAAVYLGDMKAIMKPVVFLVLAALLGVISVLVGLEADNNGGTGLCISLGVFGASCLISAVLLQAQPQR